jgi:hypothetical protein
MLSIILIKSANSNGIDGFILYLILFIVSGGCRRFRPKCKHQYREEILLRVLISNLRKNCIKKEYMTSLANKHKLYNTNRAVYSLGITKNHSLLQYKEIKQTNKEIIL